MVKKDQREYRLFCFLKKRATLLLKEGKSLSEAEEVLMDYLREFGVTAAINAQAPFEVIAKSYLPSIHKFSVRQKMFSF
jgi:hypothetical protein